MKALFGLGSLVLALIPAAAMAQQPAVCERVVFSEEVLARFPNIRKACLDVITRDGHTFAVVRAHLMRVQGRRMTVRVRLPDGTQSDPMSISVRSNARVNIDGRQVPLQDVAVGQELSAYINVTDPGIALADESPGPVEFTPLPAEPEPEPVAAAAAEPEMPKTATRLPLVGTLGLALLALGAGLAIARRRARA